ncbi:MAG: beta-ketoacyl-[acyl-carrier-protein] synthase family protein, partial [Desulfobacterales bacterium]
MSSKKAVIVGYDAVSPLGTDMVIQWQRALNGDSGVGKLTRFALADNFPVNIAGEVADIDTADYPF